MTHQLYKAEEAQAPKMEMLDETLLRTTPNAKEAARQMVASANSTQETIAKEMTEATGKNLTQYSLSRFINGNRGININEIEALINSCGNLFLLQYLANRFGKKLADIDEKEAHIKDLEYQLEQARRA